MYTLKRNVPHRCAFDHLLGMDASIDLHKCHHGHSDCNFVTVIIVFVIDSIGVKAGILFVRQSARPCGGGEHVACGVPICFISAWHPGALSLSANDV